MHICPACKSHGVDLGHVNRCKARKALRDQVAAHAKAFGVNEVKVLDLYAHIISNDRQADPVAIVQVIIELGWRPAVPQHVSDLVEKVLSDV